MAPIRFKLSKISGRIWLSKKKKKLTDGCGWSSRNTNSIVQKIDISRFKEHENLIFNDFWSSNFQFIENFNKNHTFYYKNFSTQKLCYSRAFEIIFRHSTNTKVSIKLFSVRNLIYTIYWKSANLPYRHTHTHYIEQHIWKCSWYLIHVIVYILHL